MKMRGFTLVEVLTATALAALLMLAVLKVTSSLPRAQAVMDQVEENSSIPTRLISLLRWDLQNARMMNHIRGGIVLEGFASLDPLTTRSTHLPVRITYRIASDGKDSWLIREQELLGEHTSRTKELLCQNITGIAFHHVPDPRTTNVAPRAIDGKIPDVVILQLRLGEHTFYEQQVAVR